MELKKRQIVVVTLVLMIIAAGYVNYSYRKNYDNVDFFAGKQGDRIGEPVYVDNTNTGIAEYDEAVTAVNSSNTTSSNSQDSYFSQTRFDKQRTREQEVDTLENIANNPNTSETEKDRANSNINKLIMNSDKEMIIEKILIGKGFEDCVVLISEDIVNVIVKEEGLTQQRTAQILDAVNSQTKVEFENIHIFERK